MTTEVRGIANKTVVQKNGVETLRVMIYVEKERDFSCFSPLEEINAAAKCIEKIIGRTVYDACTFNSDIILFSHANFEDFAVQSWTICVCMVITVSWLVKQCIVLPSGFAIW